MSEPFHLDAGAVYDDGSIRLGLGLSGSTLARARREGSLRYTRKGNRFFYLGRWVLDWLTGDSPIAKSEQQEVAHA